VRSSWITASLPVDTGPFYGLRPVRTRIPPEPDTDTESGTGDIADTETGTKSDTESETATYNTVPRVHEPMVPCEGGMLDPETGLCWQVPWAEEKMSWQDAIAYCDALELAGHDGWYLPDIEELITLIRGCANNEPGGVCEAHVDIPKRHWCTELQRYACSANEGPGVNGCYWDTAMGACPGVALNNGFFASSGEPDWVLDTENDTASGEMWGHMVRFYDAIPGASQFPINVMCARKAETLNR
jgi:hypothetical protein